MQAQGILRAQKAGDRQDTPAALRVEGDSHTRGRGLPGPRAHAGFGTPEALGFRVRRVPEGKIVPDDLPEMGGTLSSSTGTESSGAAGITSTPSARTRRR